MKIRISKHVFLLVLLATTSLPLKATIFFSTSLDAWQSDMTAVFGGALDQSLFVTNRANVAPTVAGGISPLPDPSDPSYESARLDWLNTGNNVDLGRTATFNNVDTKFKWSFDISAVENDTVTTSSSHNHGT